MTLTTNSSFADGKASSGEGAAGSGISPRVPTESAAINSDVPVDWPPPDRSTVAASQPASQAAATVDPGPCIGFDFEAEVAILEAQWARDGIIMDATAFFIAIFNSSDSQTEASA